MRDVFLAPHEIGSGGRTTVIADHCRMFLNEGLRPTVLTFGYSRNIGRTGANFRREYDLPDAVKVRNIHSDLLMRHCEDSTSDWSRAEDDDVHGLLAQDDEYSSKRYVRYFDEQGDYVKFRRWSDKGIPVQTTYFQQRRPVVRRNYTTAGFCGMEEHFDPRTGKVSQERYFTPDGFCYASRWLSPDDGKHSGLFVFDRANGKVKRFTDNVPWHVDWLESVLRECETRPLLIAHSPGAARKVLRVDSALADRVFVWHENHLQAPYTIGSGIRPEYADTFKRFTEMPLALFATEAQANDLRTRYPKATNIATVPPIVRDKRMSEDVATEPGRVGVFCRLRPNKRVDHIVRAMAGVIAAVPHATLHVFGRGPELAKLQELAGQLREQGKIVFHGRVEEVGDEIARCQVTVSTSAVESFGLSIGESLAAGTPVVAYDIKYGPRDIIRHGVDGYLVPSGDEKRLRRRVVDVLRDAQRAEQMGRDGQERVHQLYSAAEVTRRWRELVLE